MPAAARLTQSPSDLPEALAPGEREEGPLPRPAAASGEAGARARSLFSGRCGHAAGRAHDERRESPGADQLRAVPDTNVNKVAD